MVNIRHASTEYALGKSQHFVRCSIVRDIKRCYQIVSARVQNRLFLSDVFF